MISFYEKTPKLEMVMSELEITESLMSLVLANSDIKQPVATDENETNHNFQSCLRRIGERLNKV